MSSTLAESTQLVLGQLVLHNETQPQNQNKQRNKLANNSKLENDLSVQFSQVNFLQTSLRIQTHILSQRYCSGSQKA